MSLGASLLEDVFAAAAGREDVSIVFRGMTPGQRLPAFAMALNEMASRVGPIRPNVSINPILFTMADIQAVPVIALIEGTGDQARVVATAKGILNLDWFAKQLEQGKTGELGQYGPLSDIAESDIIEEMKQRAAGLDFKAMKQRALNGYWRQAHFETLTPATTNRERWIDPTVRIARDIRTPSGELIAMAGSRVNPLAHIAFNRLMIVFDGAIPEQIEKASEVAKEAGTRRPVFLATGLNRERGWETLAEMEKRLSGPVYLLTPDLRERFAVEHTLSVVEAVGERFRIKEIAVRAMATGGKAP
jgi:conjugal transfer pilus assembly protein TraW